MPRFVVLTHDHPVLHWDFMLENEAHLRTWRLSSPPGGPDPIPAAELAPHRLEYLDYEGPVSGNRGRVEQFDRGDYRLLEAGEGSVRVELRGSRLIGTATLEQSAGESWTFRFLPEAASQV